MCGCFLKSPSHGYDYFIIYGNTSSRKSLHIKNSRNLHKYCICMIITQAFFLISFFFFFKFPSSQCALHSIWVRETHTRKRYIYFLRDRKSHLVLYQWLRYLRASSIVNKAIHLTGTTIQLHIPFVPCTAILSQ